MIVEVIDGVFWFGKDWVQLLHRVFLRSKKNTRVRAKNNC